MEPQLMMRRAAGSEGGKLKERERTVDGRWERREASLSC